MLGALSANAQTRLVDAMRTIERVLGEKPAPHPPYILRPPRPATWAGS